MSHCFPGKRLRAGLLFVACLFFLTGTGFGVVFDWTKSYGTWSAGTGGPAIGGSTSQTYNSDNAHAGNDVRITLVNTAGRWRTSTPRMPSVGNSYNGGSGKALQLGFDSETSTTKGLTVKIDFLYTGGVTNVSFSIFDVDWSGGTWVDRIDQIQGITADGEVVGAHLVTGSADNQITGSGTSYMATGVNSNADGNSSSANVTISFGDVAVTQVSFRWLNIDNGKGGQVIGLGNITYTPTPEVGTGVVSALACAGAVLWGFFAKRKRKPILGSAE